MSVVVWVKFSLASTLMIASLSMIDFSVASVLSKMTLGTQILDHSTSEQVLVGIPFQIVERQTRILPFGEEHVLDVHYAANLVKLQDFLKNN